MRKRLNTGTWFGSGRQKAAAMTLLLSLLSAPLVAATRHVGTDPGALADAISAAAPGDVLLLGDAVYEGPVVVDKSLVLDGGNKAVIDGRHIGNSLHIKAPDVTIRHLTVINSGEDLAAWHSGIFVDRDAHNVLIDSNLVENNLISIYLWGPRDGIVRNNRVYGRQDLRLNERGNGVQLWRSKGSIIEGNDIQFGRDGIYVTNSKNNVFRRNRFTNTRFAIHYMYTHKSEVSDNYSTGNHIGFALMNSTGLTVRGNISDGDRDHGLALNYTNKSVFENNVSRNIGDKCLFIYNSNRNSFRGNRFEGCAIGVHYTAGSSRNRFSDNAFAGNELQVKYVGSRDLEWSVDGRGNYWSDHAAFDLDGDGLADSIYKPNDMMDRIVWAAPRAKMLLNSPAVQLLRWAQGTFPGLWPGGISDSAPLMVPPVPATMPDTQFPNEGGVPKNG